jgi:2-polyprenyl-3-methyl-5-hydroxy-6-metoxy-1,4-benzoquinol methylase
MELNSKNLNKFLNSTEDVDKEMIRDCLKNYNLEEVNFENKICLDLGANIGGFSKIAIENGASLTGIILSRIYYKLLS